MQIGFIGAGNMASALVGGLSARGAPDIVVCDSVATQLAAIARRFAVTTSADSSLAARADIVVLAVKPQDMPAVAREIGPTIVSRRPLVLSVAAGVRLEAISAWLGGHERIVRVMPNRPALIGAGVAGLYTHASLAAADREAAEELLGTVGATVWVPREADLDIVTAVSGSGPAYFFLLIEMLEDAARELGLTDATARTLAIETAHGAALLARAHEGTPAELREQVTSRGGTTAAALAVLEEADVRGIVRRAVAAAARRSAELAAQFGA